MNGATGQIDFCEEPTSSEGSIDFCEETDASEGTINFCAECAGLDPLVISGPGGASVGAGYTASGGKAPYTYSISCGVIGEDGVIDSLTDCCGSGTVTVRDDCGNSASMEVRFPNGQWVYREQYIYKAYSGDLPTCVPLPSAGSCSQISGSKRYSYDFGQTTSYWVATCGYNDGPVPPCATPTPPAVYVTRVLQVEYWECI